MRKMAESEVEDLECIVEADEEEKKRMKKRIKELENSKEVSELKRSRKPGKEVVRE
jgi:predicted nucleotidyltransferase